MPSQKPSLISIINMHCLLLSLLLLLCPLLQSLSRHQHLLLIPNSTLVSQSVPLDAPSRLTFFLYSGLPQGHLRTHNSTHTINSSYQQFVFTHPSNVTVELNGPAVGVLRRQPLQQWRLLPLGEELFLDLGLGRPQAVAMQPRKRVMLNVHRLAGLSALAYVRCDEQEKRDCVNRLQRIDHIPLYFPLEKIKLQACSSCTVMLHFSGEGRVRITTDNVFSVLAGEPGVGIMDAGSTSKWLIQGIAGQRGTITLLDGKVEMTSQSRALELRVVEGGWDYELSSTDGIELEIGCISKSVFIVYAPQSEGTIQLKDGLPYQTLLKDQVQVFLPPGLISLHLTASTSLLTSLALKVASPSRTHSLKPTFFFSQPKAHYSFRLDNSSSQYKVFLQASTPAPINLLASGTGPVLLGSGQSYSSVLLSNKSDTLMFAGGEGELVLKKCVDCHLEVKAGLSESSLRGQEMTGRQLIIPLEQVRVLQVATNNYAFYSVQIRSSIQGPVPQLPNSALQVFLVEPLGEVELEFEVPLCGALRCEDVQYSLIEGSDFKAVTARGYCPNSLFDLPQHTQDVFIQPVSPTFAQDRGIVRPTGTRDWAVVVMQVGNTLLSTDTADIGEVRSYSKLRWPLFYFFTFLTLAAVVAVAVVMAAGRSRRPGYVPVGSSGADDL